MPSVTSSVKMFEPGVSETAMVARSKKLPLK